MMTNFPTPTEPGYYWAKWKVADDGPMAEEYRSYLPCSHWEPMDVFENAADPDDPEHLMVHIPGVASCQSVENFFWGPRILPDFEVSQDENDELRRELGEARSRLNILGTAETVPEALDRLLAGLQRLDPSKRSL